MMAAALGMILQRSNGAAARQTLNPLAAASSASSRSARSACATVPMVSSVAGLSTAMVLPDWLGRHLPLMNSCVLEYATRLAPSFIVAGWRWPAEDQAPL